MADTGMQQESNRIWWLDGVDLKKMFLTYSVLWTFIALIGCKAEQNPYNDNLSRISFQAILIAWQIHSVSLLKGNKSCHDN